MRHPYVCADVSLSQYKPLKRDSAASKQRILYDIAEPIHPRKENGVKKKRNI